MMQKPRIFPAVLLFAMVLSGGCGKSGSAGSPGRESQGIPVSIEQAQQQTYVEKTEATGTVVARESVTLTAKVSELVERVHFESGQEVARGAALVTLSGQQQQANLQAAEANAAEAEQLYQRYLQLAEQQLIARATLDTQKASRDASRAQVAQIRAQLGERVVRAPFSGVLGIRQVSPGALVTPGTVLTTLDDISRVYVDFPLPEAQLAHLAVGQRLTGATVAWPGRTFEGVVSAINTRIDPASRAVMVRADFANDDRALRPGMLFSIKLQQAERRALMVPEIAITQVGRERFVWKVDAENKVRQSPVETGQREAGKVEITQGLHEGERIVVEGVGKLRNGQSVVDAADAAKLDEKAS
ncbi:efflux transporter periplasmic adaptor subunit [Lysobacteraceae bacterium NML120232]|nr:efflux transporter periplasmic adaptor subunit [Xanthomonadaceae bacterium NML08-0793]PJK13254.1 efflux transporter periplasmic adaptor subunit [Xanthomonadaceae bacterium NML120232]